MKETGYVLRLLSIITIGLLLSGEILAQSGVQNTLNKKNSPTRQSLNRKKNDLRPENAIRVILAAFDKYEVVGMDAAHGNKDLDDLILRLVRDPALSKRVNDIVVECGNSLCQGILDRNIAGEDLPLFEVHKVRRDTTATMCSVSGFYEMLFPLVRRINQKLPPAERLRVLAGDPPLDWSKVKEQSDVMLDRDANIASVMENEVLSKTPQSTYVVWHRPSISQWSGGSTRNGISGEAL